MKKISIIIPIINEANIIVERLSYLQSIIQHSELIVVDGGSDDNSLSIAREFSDQVLVSSTKSRSAQMNAGASVATGDIILFLHIDTVLPRSFENDLINVNDKQWGFFRVKLSGRAWAFRAIEAMMNIRSRLTSVATGDQCLFIGADLFKHVKGYANIPLMEDVEISKRLRKVQSPIIIKHAVVTSSRRWEDFGIFKTVLLMWTLRWSFFIGGQPEKLVKKYYRAS